MNIDEAINIIKNKIKNQAEIDEKILGSKIKSVQYQLLVQFVNILNEIKENK